MFNVELQPLKNKRRSVVFDRALRRLPEWFYNESARRTERRIAMHASAGRSEAFVATGAWCEFLHLLLALRGGHVVFHCALDLYPLGGHFVFYRS